MVIRLSTCFKDNTIVGHENMIISQKSIDEVTLTGSHVNILNTTESVIIGHNSSIENSKNTILIGNENNIKNSNKGLFIGNGLISTHSNVILGNWNKNTESLFILADGTINNRENKFEIDSNGYIISEQIDLLINRIQYLENKIIDMNQKSCSCYDIKKLYNDNQCCPNT